MPAKQRKSKAAEEVAHARATVAGPALLAACRPVAERLREQMKHAVDDIVGVFLTVPEAEAMIAAVEKADGTQAAGQK
jgi:hypothetical protein